MRRRPFRVWANGKSQALAESSTGLLLLVIDAAGTGATETITVVASGSDTINAAATSKTITAAYGGLWFMTISSTKWICWAWTPA